MKRHRLHASFVCLTVLLFGSLLCSAQERVLVVGDEELRFTLAPERGYVIKLREGGDLRSLEGMSGLDVAKARPIHGLDRHGLWTVENAGSVAKNKQTMTTLRQKAPVSYVAPLFSSHGETVAIIPEIVVHVAPDIKIEDVQSLCPEAGCVIKKRMEFTTQEYLLEVFGWDAEALFTAVETLICNPGVEWACPNIAVHIKPCGEVIPNDEYFPLQWHLHNTGQSGGTPGTDIRAPEAWEITTGNPDTIVALLDNDFDLNHPDLFRNLMSGYDFVDGDDEPEPPHNEPTDAHGTACAGLVAAVGNNVIGVTGVVWDCKIMPIRIEGPSGELITEAEIATAFRWAANHGADVINNSWATLDNPLPVVRSGIINATEPGGIGRNGKGCVVLGASGNNGHFVSYPARYPEMISVGASDHHNLRWYYSGYGPELDLVAPSGGEGWDDWFATMGRDWMWTTDITGAAGFSEWNSEDGWEAGMLDYNANGGTSSACPVAAGVAALILSVEPELSNVEVRQFLEYSAKDLGEPGRDDYYGWGRVDARAALDLVLAKRADLNDDLIVDIDDLLILIDAWGTENPLVDIAPATNRDAVVDELDLQLLTDYWHVKMLDLGLLAHWPFDETEGMGAEDVVSQKSAWVLNGAVWQPEGGMVGGALELDGVDDIVLVESSPDLGGRAFSVLAWVRGGGPGQVIISQVESADWLLADPSTGALMTTIAPPSSRSPIPPLTSDYVITDGQWHRIGFVYDGTDRILYADGIEVARDTQDSPQASSAGLYFGCGNERQDGTFWSGMIDDVRIYNRIVTP